MLIGLSKIIGGQAFLAFTMSCRELFFQLSVIDHVDDIHNHVHGNTPCNSLIKLSLNNMRKETNNINLIEEIVDFFLSILIEHNEGLQK